MGLFACQECAKTFSKRSNLERHMQIHLGLKMFACDVCQKAFGQKSNLERHAATCTPTSEPKVYTCEQCMKVFAKKSNLDRHMDTHRPTLAYRCVQCSKTFSSGDAQRRHEREHSMDTQHPCTICGKVFNQKSNMLQHRRVMHNRTPLVSIKRKSSPSTSSGLIKKVKRVKVILGTFSDYEFTPSIYTERDLKLFEQEVRPQLQTKLEEELEEKSAIKWYPTIKLVMTRTAQDGEDHNITVPMHCKCQVELIHNSIPDHLDNMFTEMECRLEKFVQNGSGYTLKKIIVLELHSAKYHPLVGRSYISTPEELMAKRALVNIQNFHDNKCLVWSLLAHKMKIETHAERVNLYQPHESEIKLGDVPCPVPLEKMPTIEHLNNLSINVYTYYKNEVEPVYVSPRMDEDHVDLLLIANDSHQHYVLIRNMSRLLGDLTGHDGARFYCPRCLHRCSTAAILKDHRSYCNEHRPQKIYMPETGKNNILEFKNIHYSEKVPYIIYADFESLLVPMPSTSPSEDVSYTEKINMHKACSYGFNIVDKYGNSERVVETYLGDNPIHQFIVVLLEQMEILSKKLGHVEPLVMTEQQEGEFQAATTCNVCNEPLNDDKVRDHDHLSGLYRQALHNKCNLNYRQSKVIPVVFHNLRNYDSRHIITELSNFPDVGIDVIATGMENYISFRIYRKNNPKISLRFIDSYQFLKAPLEKLVSTLDPEDFKFVKDEFPEVSDISLLTRKGVYPYEYMDCMERFTETSLPPFSAFYSSLTGTTITQREYDDAQEVWDAMHIKNMREYHDLYLKTDVLLLADVFEKFRNFSLHHYQIDPAHVVTAASLAWQASLKMNDHPLELLTDIDQHLFIERGIRGGVSMISQRFAQANNPEVPNYDSTLPNSWIMYLDANNLYGWSMSQPLPCGEFEWAKPEDVCEEWVKALEDEAEYGYILEVDLQYPHHLHDRHNEYPLAPEKLKVTKDMLSPYACEMLKILNANYTPQTKLNPNLQDKANYVVHYRNLKYYLSQGLKMTRVHKILKFRQSTWLNTYIQYNTRMRREAKTLFEREFFKLMNNAVYGKTMENLRNRIDIQLVNDERRAKKLVASPAFKRSSVFHENLVGVERMKTSILLNRPIYVGFSVLELSKLLMYKFHYGFMKSKFEDKARLLFTDTDSLTYHIEDPNIYETLYQHKDHFDLSEYQPPYHSDENKKAIGKFKDELNGDVAVEFVGLRPKMYSLTAIHAKNNKKTAKGVKKAFKKLISHRQYKESLECVKSSRVTQYCIGQEKHKLFTYRQRKIALSPFDDKRYILDDGITSLAYGHYAI